MGNGRRKWGEPVTTKGGNRRERGNCGEGGEQLWRKRESRGNGRIVDIGGGIAVKEMEILHGGGNRGAWGESRGKGDS